MVPSWVPDIPAPAPDSPASPGGAPPGSAPPVSPPRPPIPTAPAGRFSSTRRAAGNFARTGSSENLKRSLGHYVRTGYGGARTAARRMGGTARTAGSLYSALSPGAPGPGEPETTLDRNILRGRSAREVMDVIVQAVRPGDGTLDGDASREAVKGSLVELLKRFPEADLLDLSEEQRAFAVEQFVALDVFQLYVLDIGKTIQDKASTSRAVLSRLREAKNYIKQTVSAEFRKLAADGQVLSRRTVTQIVQRALLRALQVFEHFDE
jgi:hypothetical protein